MITQKNVTIETQFYPNGKLLSRTYKNADGQYSRDHRDGPAFESFYTDGALSVRSFYVNGKRSRPSMNGPSFESFYNNGKISSREYRVDGQFSRNPQEGAAIESFYRDGTLCTEKHWLLGKSLTDAEVQAILNPPPTPKPVPAPVVLPEISITINGENYRLVKE